MFTSKLARRAALSVTCLASLAAPVAGASKETVARFNKALVDALNSIAVKARFQTLALESLPGTPTQMSEHTRADRERWGKLIKVNGIKLD